jgi:hypothetical protein
MQDPRDVTRDDEDGERFPSSLAPCFQEYALHALDLGADFATHVFRFDRD